jgi:superfamily I DNA/RNA helicase
MESLSESSELLVRGSAGTGKTVLAVNNARRLAANGHSTLLLCFNTPLARLLKNIVGDVERLTVDSFHGFAYKLLERADIDHSDDELLPLLLIEAAQLLHTSFDAIVVDEAQDFMADWWDSVNALFTSIPDRILHIFADSNQNIYEGSGLELFKSFTKVNLTINCRNTIDIAQLAHKCCNIKSTVKGTNGPKPVFKLVENESELPNLINEQINEWINEYQILPQDIAVLTDSKDVADEYFDSHLNSIHLLDGEEGTIHVETIQRFKGLEAEAVLCVFEPFNEYSETLDAELLKLGYIGLSRARTLLTIISNQNKIDKLQLLTH